MEGASNDRNKFTTDVNIQGFPDDSQIGVTLVGDDMMSLANASMYATIAQAEFKESGSAEPEYVSEVDKKRMRDKTRKDKIRQGIHKLSELLPTEFHSREGQKETLVSILEKAAEFMQTMTKPGQDLLEGGSQNVAAKLQGDVLNELKTLDSIKSDKEFGDMEDALSLMASSVAEQTVNSMALTNQKLGNNNTLELVNNENQENSGGISTMDSASIQSQGDSSSDISKTFLSMQGDQSFMAGMGGGMFADGGPLLPSLMSPMIPGSQMGGMLGSFPAVNASMLQNSNLGGVNSAQNNTQPQNINSVQPFNANFSQDNNLFASPVTVESSSTPRSVNNSQQSSNTSVTCQPQTDAKTSISLTQLGIKHESNEQSSSALQMSFSSHSNSINNAQTSAMTSSVISAQNQESQQLQRGAGGSVGSIALFTQPSSMQQQLINTSAVNTSIHMSSTNVITPSTNFHITSNLNNANFVNMGNATAFVSNHTIVGTNTSTVAANASAPGLANQKGVMNVVNNMPVIGHPQQVGNTIQQATGITQLNQNMTAMSGPVQGTTLGPVAPLQGTLVLHNNQLILVPNNQQVQPQQQQQQQVINPSGIAVNQNLQSNIINQAAVQQQQQHQTPQTGLPAGVLGGNFHAMHNVGAGGSAQQTVLNAGIQNSTMLKCEVGGSSMQSMLAAASTQAQALQKAGVITGGVNPISAPRIGLNHQPMIGNTQGVIQGNQGAGSGAAIAQQSGGQQTGTGTVQVNTPQGVVQMNTAPSAPNQLPSALILPNGQIVPVVTQPNAMPQHVQQQQQPIVQATGNNLVLPNQIGQQAGQQLTIQTPGTTLGTGNQIVGCSVGGGGTGLLMTTASSQTVRPSIVNTVASNTCLKTLSATGQQNQPTMQYIPAAVSAVLPRGATGILNRPMFTVAASKPNTLVGQAKPVVTSKVSSKSSKYKSKKNLMTSLPNTVQAMLTPEGNIILSLPVHAGTATGTVLGKPLTPVTTVCNITTKSSTTSGLGVASAAVKKMGQRIIMPKPTSGAPVATIAPLLPGQPTNLMVSNNAMASTPITMTTQCFPKGVPNPPLQPPAPSIAAVAAASINPLSVCVSSVSTLSTPPPVCSTHVTAPPQPAPPSTDILAKAAASIFQASPGNTGMSPNFYNPANDDNPLQIDDATVSASISHSAVASSAAHTHSVSKAIITQQPQPVVAMPSNQNDKAQLENSSGHGGAKPKSIKPKKPSKPSKKKAKSGDSKVDGNKPTHVSQFAPIMGCGQTDPQPPGKGDLPAFQMATDHFIPDLADNLDDGDDESDINDFQDLLRFHDQKPHKSSGPIIQQSNSLTELIATTTSCDTACTYSLPGLSGTLQKQEVDILNNAVTSLQTNTSSPETMIGLFDTTRKEQSADDGHVQAISLGVGTSTETVTFSPAISPSVISSSDSAQVSPLSMSSSASFVHSMASSAVTTTPQGGDISAVSTLATNVESGPTYTSASTSLSCNAQKSTTVTSVLSPVISTSESITTMPSVDVTMTSKTSAASLDISSEFGKSVSPNMSTYMMGLTPMEIIQNYAENSGKEKSPKETKEPSPRISKKKLEKAGKGPPQTRRDASKSPKRCDTEPSKSPTNLNDVHIEEEDMLKMSKDLFGLKPVEDIAEKKTGVEQPKKETTKSPKKPSPRKQTKSEKITQPKPGQNKSEKLSPPKTTKSSKQQEKGTNLVKNATPVADHHIDVINKGGKSAASKKSKQKAKEKSLAEKEQNLNLSVESEDDYPDEPPKLEKEEPFVLSKTMDTYDLGKQDKVDNHGMDRLDYLAQEKVRQEKKDENIFMNAITSEKPSFFGSTPSLFPPSAIPPFSTSSMPPPFGFGNPAFFRLPMMANASSGLTGFQHHLPMFAQPPSLFSSNNFGKLPFQLPEQSPPCRSSEVSEAYKANDGAKDMSNSAVDANSKKRKKKSKKEKKKDKLDLSEDVPLKNDAIEKEHVETPSINSISSPTEVGFVSHSTVPNQKSELEDNLKSSTKSDSEVPKSELSQTDKLSSESQIESSSLADKQVDLHSDKRKRKEKKKKKDKRKRDKSESEYEFEIVQHSMIEEDSENKDNDMYTVKESEEENLNSKTNNEEPVAKPVVEAIVQPVVEPVVENILPRKSRSRSRKKVSKTAEKDPGNKVESTEITPQVIPQDKINLDFAGETSPSKDSRKSYSLRGRGLSPKSVLEESPDIFEEDPALIRREDPNYDDIPASPEAMGEFSLVKISPLKADKVDEEKIEQVKPAPRKGRSRSKKGKVASQVGRKAASEVQEKVASEVEEKVEDDVMAEDSYSVFSSGTETKGKNKGIKLKISSRTSSDSPIKVMTPIDTSADQESVFGKLGSPIQSTAKGGRFQRKLDRSPKKSTPKSTSNFLKSKLQEEKMKNKSIDVFDFDDEPDDDLPCTLKSFSSKSKDITQSKVHSDSDVFAVSHEELKAVESPTRQPALKLMFGKGRGKKRQIENVQKFAELDRTLSSEFADSEPSLNTTCESISDVTQKVKKPKKTAKSKKKNNKQQEEVTTESLIPPVSVVPVETTDSELNETQEAMEPKKESKKPKGKIGKKSKSAASEKETPALDMHQENTDVNTNIDSSQVFPKTDITKTDTEKKVSGRDISSTKKGFLQKDVSGHSGLEKTIKALHERLQSTSPVRIPIVPLETPCDATEKKAKSNSRKRTRESSQSESEALDLSMQDNKSMQSLANKPIQHDLLSSQSDSTAKDLNNTSGEFDKPFLKQPNTKKGRKPRKRGKDEAGLDNSVFQNEESGTQSEPTPAKVPKSDETFNKPTPDQIHKVEEIVDKPTPAKLKKPNETFGKVQPADNLNGDTSNKAISAEQSNPEPAVPEKVKEKKPKRRSSSKSKGNSETQGSSLLSDGAIPDQITFTENDLFAVLDQVEGQGQDAEEPATPSQKTDPLSDELSPLKKSRLQIDESVREADVMKSPAAEPPTADKTDTQPSESVSEAVENVPNASKESKDVPLPSETISSQELSPCKREKKRDRKKRRKEKHMVKEMSESELSSKESLTVIDSIQLPKAPVAEEMTSDLTELGPLPDGSPHSLTSIGEPKPAKDNVLDAKPVEQQQMLSKEHSTASSSPVGDKEEHNTEKSSSDVVPTTNVISTSAANIFTSSKFKIPHPMPDLTTVPARGNPPRPLERTSTTSHLVARIPKKRIDAYQKEYTMATQQLENASNSLTSLKSVAADDKMSSNDPMDPLDSLNGKSMIESLSQATACVSDFSYGSEKTDSDMDTNNLSSITSMTSDSSTSNMLSSQDSRKESESYSNKTTSKFIDLDYIPPSPLSSARHSHLGSLAQVASLRATSIVMPASPRTPMATIGSKSRKKDKEKTEKKDQPSVPPAESNDNMNKSASDGNHVINTSANSMDSCESDKSNVHEKTKSDSNIITEMAPPAMLPAVKPIEKDLKNDDLPAPYSPEVNYSAEPLFSPPSILPPDSVHQDLEHSPTMPDPIQQQKPKDASPAPAPAQMYNPSNSYMNTNQGVDLSQRGMYGQEANASSSTCALQAAKPGIYDNFSPPYASQASSGPSPSMGSNPGSNQMLSPNMNSSVVNTTTTTSYTSTTPNNQMAGQVGQRYPGYYPMPSNAGNQQQQATPGPPPPLTMQQYGMEPQRDRQQNRTPGMSNSDRMTSPHPSSNQPKNYSSYMSEPSASQQHNTQQQSHVETQRLAHPEKEASSRRNSHGSSGHSHSSTGHSHGSGNSSHSSSTQMQSGQAVGGSNQRRSSTGRSPGMNTDNQGSSHNAYYPQTSYTGQGHSASHMTSPPLHHRGPAPREQNTQSSQRPNYDVSFSNANAAYQSLASYSSYESLPISGNSSSSSHNQNVQQQQQQQQQSQKTGNQSQTVQSAKNLSNKPQQQQSSSSSHQRQQQQRQAQQQQQQQQQQHSMQQSVKSSSNRSSSSSSSKNPKKGSSSSKSAYEMDPAMMNSMFDPSRSMTPYFAFPNLHSPSRNYHPEANSYFSGMFGNHQRQSSQHKGSEMNNPFMFAHSRSQNGIAGLSWGGMNHPAHSNHAATSQNSHSNSQTPHLSGFNFNLFGAAEMNSSHSQEGINLSPIKLPHGNILSQHGMEHNALQHQSLYQNRGQMAPSMLQHPMSFLGHQHPGFDGRSMGAGAHFGSHGHGFGMPFLPD